MKGMTPALAEAMGKLVGRAFEARRAADGRPFIVGFFATNRCNCFCASCLWKHDDWEDVPTEDVKRFYAEAREEGFLATAITGGEPFLRRDLGELVRYVRRDLGMPILLFTTGWFLKRRMDEVLPHVDMLMLSVDSARAERHDAIRGVPGLFDRMVEAVGVARARYPDLTVHLNCCVQAGIAEEIDDLVALAERLGVRISFDVVTEFRNAAGGERFTETDTGLALDDLRTVCGRLLELKRAGAPIVNSEMYFQYFVDGRPGYRCHLPKLVMFVDGRGQVEDCLQLDRPIASIRDTPLREIMALPRFRQLRADAEACSTCSSPTMVDVSRAWEDPTLFLQAGGIRLG